MVLHMLITLNMSGWSKILSRSTTISTMLLSTSIKTLSQARAATSFKDRQIGAYSIWPNHSLETWLSRQEPESV